MMGNALSMIGAIALAVCFALWLSGRRRTVPSRAGALPSGISPWKNEWKTFKVQIRAANFHFGRCSTCGVTEGVPFLDFQAAGAIQTVWVVGYLPGCRPWSQDGGGPPVPSPRLSAPFRILAARARTLSAISLRWSMLRSGFSIASARSSINPGSCSTIFNSSTMNFSWNSESVPVIAIPSRRGTLNE